MNLPTSSPLIWGAPVSIIILIVGVPLASISLINWCTTCSTSSRVVTGSVKTFARLDRIQMAKPIFDFHETLASLGSTMAYRVYGKAFLSPYQPGAPRLTSFHHMHAAASLVVPIASPHSRPATRLHALPELATLAFAPPPACFDTACQRNKDFIFLASLIGPVLAFAAAVALTMKQRPPPDDSTVFDDAETGVSFQAPEGVQPARDRKGNLAFRPVSYTPWPVEADADDEPVRIHVGPVGALQPRTFLFAKLLPQPSRLIVVPLPRPLGIVFEEESKTGRAVVAEVVPGSNAEQLRKRAALDPALAASAPKEGDVLRAVTCTNIVYQTGALLFGAQTPKRALVVFGADGQRWPNVAAALQKGLAADGDVTLVLERRRGTSQE